MPDGFNNVPPSPVLDNIASQLSGIISTRPSARYMSGARCVLKINSQLVGFAFGITWNIRTDVVEINTIDDYLPYELAPRRVSVDGTLSALHIPGTSATTELWQPDVLSFLFNKYVSIEVRDSATDALLFATDKAIITSRTEDIRVDQLASVTLQWRAIGWLDERTPSLPDGVNQDSTQNVAATNASPLQQIQDAASKFTSTITGKTGLA